MFVNRLELAKSEEAPEPPVSLVMQFNRLRQRDPSSLPLDDVDPDALVAITTLVLARRGSFSPEPDELVKSHRRKGPPGSLNRFPVFGVSLRGLVDADGLKGTFPDPQAEGGLLNAQIIGLVGGSLAS